MNRHVSPARPQTYQTTLHAAISLLLTGADIGTVEEIPPEHGVLEALQASAAEGDSVLEGRDGFVLKGTVAPAGER